MNVPHETQESQTEPLEKQVKVRCYWGCLDPTLFYFLIYQNTH